MPGLWCLHCDPNPNREEEELREEGALGERVCRSLELILKSRKNH